MGDAECRRPLLFTPSRGNRDGRRLLGARGPGLSGYTASGQPAVLREDPVRFSSLGFGRHERSSSCREVPRSSPDRRGGCLTRSPFFHSSCIRGVPFRWVRCRSGEPRRRVDRRSTGLLPRVVDRAARGGRLRAGRARAGRRGHGGCPGRGRPAVLVPSRRRCGLGLDRGVGTMRRRRHRPGHRPVPLHDATPSRVVSPPARIPSRAKARAGGLNPPTPPASHSLSLFPTSRSPWPPALSIRAGASTRSLDVTPGPQSTAARPRDPFPWPLGPVRHGG